MQGTKIVKYVFGAAAAWWIWQKINFSQKVKFYVSKIDVAGSFYNPLVILSIAVTNPTQTITTVSNIQAELFLNGSLKVADVFFNDKTTIAANSQTIIPLNIYPNIANVISTLQNVIAIRNGNFVLKGSALVDGFNIPFNLNYQLI